MKEEKKIYSGLDRIPRGQASNDLIDGCMVLEGGAWRGIYTQGVLDALMENGINMRATVGVSAGAMAGLNYASGQIGRSARINLRYRHDTEYMGIKPFEIDHGITGFHFVFGDAGKDEPLDTDTLRNTGRKLFAVATDVETGEAVYFDQDEVEDIIPCIIASATVPYVSLPVEIGGRKYLDGGMSTHIPFRFAIQQGYEKIIVVKTRDRSYRRKSKRPSDMVRALYHKYPALQKNIFEETPRYDLEMDELDRLERMGKVYVIAPEDPITISRFEGNMEKLGDLYWRGYNETNLQIENIKAYLEK